MNLKEKEEQKGEGNSFGKVACMAIGAVAGIAILKGLGVGGAIVGGLGALVGACVGELVYRTAVKNK